MVNFTKIVWAKFLSSNKVDNIFINMVEFGQKSDQLWVNATTSSTCNLMVRRLDDHNEFCQCIVTFSMRDFIHKWNRCQSQDEDAHVVTFHLFEDFFIIYFNPNDWRITRQGNAIVVTYHLLKRLLSEFNSFHGWWHVIS